MWVWITASVCCLLKTVPSPLMNCHMPSDGAVGSCHMKCPLLPNVYAVDLSGYGSGGAVVPQVAQRLSGVMLCGMWHRLHMLAAGGRICGDACGVGLLDGNSLRSRCDLIALIRRLFLVESSVWQAVRSRTIFMVV